MEGVQESQEDTGTVCQCHPSQGLGLLNTEVCYTVSVFSKSEMTSFPTPGQSMESQLLDESLLSSVANRSLYGTFYC